MSEIEQKLSKYVGHLTEGALRSRNELFVGMEAPDFELRPLDGQLVRLSDYKGKSNVVLIFGSFTCGNNVQSSVAERRHEGLRANLRPSVPQSYYPS